MTVSSSTIVRLSTHMSALTGIVDEILQQSQEEELNLEPLEKIIHNFENDLKNIHDMEELMEQLEYFQQSLVKITHLLIDKRATFKTQIDNENSRKHGVNSYLKNQFLSNRNRN